MPQCDNSNILLLWLMKLAPQCANIVMGTLPKVINWWGKCTLFLLLQPVTEDLVCLHLVRHFRVSMSGFNN